MSIINSILNLVDLNTTKYTKKLKKMRTDTKTATKGIGQSFASLGSAWKAAIAGIAAGALTGAITKELAATEKSVASFITSTGSLTEARAQFEMLQQAARDTIQPFDALKAVALELRKNGIQVTAEQLKTFSQIAYATGISIDEVGKSFTDALHGKSEGFEKLGITAKDTGTTMALTYKGVTKEIEKNSDALMEYYKELGKENEGVLDYLQWGMTGALNHLDNAWGDFYRAIAEAGLGQAIADTVREVAKALDSITGWINRNQKTVQGFFAGWSFYVKKLGANFESLRQGMEDWLTSADKVKKTGGEETDIGILGWINSAAETVGSKLYELFNGSTDERAYKAQKERIVEMNKQRLAAYKKGTDEYYAEIERGNQRIVDLERLYADKQTTVLGRLVKHFDLDDIALKMHRNLEKTAGEYDQFVKDREEERKKLERATAPQYRPRPIRFGTTTTGTTPTGPSAATRHEADTWVGYFARVQRIQQNGYSSVEKIRTEHQAALRELQEEYAKSSIATETEYQQARATLEAEFQRNIKEQRQEASDFLHSVAGDEEQQLRDEYSRKLEQLEQYHADALVSDEEFLQAQQKLRDDYEQERARTRGAKNDFFTADDQKNAQQLSDALGDLGDAFGNLTTGMSESSGAYRALFATQKAFAVASATANAILAWSQALSDPSQVSWIAKLAQYANAIALTTGIISQLNSVQMHDKGGRIPAGQLGIVGEYGPELIQGPVDVTSRKRTAELARQAAGGTATPVTVNLYENAERAGQVEQQDNTDGERIINIFVSNIRRGGAAARAMENTYQLRRYGA